MATRLRYQKGNLLKMRRAGRASEWVLRYRVTLPDGSRAQRQAIVGGVDEYKTRSQAEKAADQVRLTINNASPMVQVPTVGLVAAHFKDVELNESNPRRSWSTKTNYRDTIDLYILPRWETTRMLDVKSVDVEKWLSTLGHKADPKKPLADPTKQRTRNVFSVLFTHAQRYEFVPIGHNPIKLVRQSGKRSRVPDILEPGELNAIWNASDVRERAAISIEYGNGLRVSEAFAWKWADLDFENLTASVVKAIVKGHLGSTKTEVSKKLVPLHPLQIEDLKAWRAKSPYPDDEDWVFASSRMKGKKPLLPDMILKRHIRKTAERLGIEKRIEWRTFRRTYASLLLSNKEDVKVAQELLRHSKPMVFLYAQAFSDDAREAQGKIVEMVRNAPMPERKNPQESPSTA